MTMFEPTQQNIDEALRQSIDLFERSRVGDVAAIEARSPNKLLLVVDGSAQDDMGQAVARGLRHRFPCAIDVLDAREGEQSDDLAGRLAHSLGGTALTKQVGESYEQILAAIAESQPDLVIVPCPYGRNLERIGTDSTGTVIDVLMARSPVPMLVVRNTYPLEAELFQHVLMVLMGENEAVPAAARWAIGLTAPGGQLLLKLVLTQETFENVRELLRSLKSDMEVTPEQLAQALQRSHIRLHRALQISAEGLRFHYQLDVRREDQGPTAAPDLTGGQQQVLLVLALECADLTSQGHVRDRIRQSPHCVLVVARD